MPKRMRTRRSTSAAGRWPPPTRRATAATWRAAVTAYHALAASDPQDGQSWLNLGVSMHLGGDLPAAAVAH